MKISALIPSTDQVIKMERLVKLVKKAGADEVIVASKPGQKFKGVKVVRGGSTRGEDYNRAARVGKGEIFALIHQNTLAMPKRCFSEMKEAMRNEQVVGGGVNIKFDNPHWFLKLVAFLSNNYRMRFRKVIYCDQTIFIRKSTYRKMRGFKKMPIFEDTDFSVRLRKQGKLVFLKGPVVTSAHRFVKSGVMLHTVRNQLLKLFYNLGFSPRILRKIYTARLFS